MGHRADTAPMSPESLSDDAPVGAELNPHPSEACSSAVDRPPSPISPNEDFARQLVSLARTVLGLDAMWISEFKDGCQVFAVVDASPTFGAVSEGVGLPLDDSVCALVSSNRAPNVIADSKTHPQTQHLEVHHTLGFHGYVGAPILSTSGEPVGMLCGISRDVRPGKAADDDTIKLFADMVTNYRRQLEAAAGDRSRSALQYQHRFSCELNIVFQPIVELETGRIASVEALSRFTASPMSPLHRFQTADILGRGVQVEAIAAQRALGFLSELPPNVALSVNASPAFIRSSLIEVLAPVRSDLARVTIEVTEHQADHDLETLRERIELVRSLGCRIAIDDVGTGYSGLQRMIQLRPDIVKLDRVLVDHCDLDPLKRAVISATVQVCAEADVLTVAEGIERVAEANALIEMGVDCGQGFLLARPEPLPLPDWCPVPAA